MGSKAYILLEWLFYEFDLVITQNNVEVDYKNGISIDQLSDFEIIIIPDKSFAKYHEEDIRYRVNQIVVYLIRGEEDLQMIEESTIKSINLSSLKELAKEGDRIYFKIFDLQRMNFKGQIELIALTHGNQFNLPIK